MPPGSGTKRKSGLDDSCPDVPASSSIVHRNPSSLLDTESAKKRRVESRNITLESNISSRGDQDDTRTNVLYDPSPLMKSLKEAGFFVKDGKGHPNILNDDQALFLKKFTKDVNTHMDYPENIISMTETLSKWFDEETLLIKCLEPTKTSGNCGTARSEIQDSLVRLLLSVEDIQPKLLTILLEKLAETSIVQEGEEQSQAVNIPRMILTSVRWLDKLVDGDGLADKMSEILSATSRYQQVEVIAALPEILPQQQHTTIAEHLLTMMEDSQPLVSSIVDCLGNLHLFSETIDKTRKVLIQSMASSRFHFNDLPNIVEYLLSSPSKKLETCMDLVRDLRDNLELTAKMRPSQRPGPSSAKSRDSRDQDSKRNIECIILDKINISMMTEKKMSEAWVHVLEGVKEAEEMKPLDILVMIMLYKNKQRRKTVEMMFKNKIRTGVLTNNLFNTTFEKHTTVLKHWMSSVLDIANMLIMSPDPLVSEGAGKQLYVSAFINLGELCEREIVSEVVSSVSRSGTALSVLGQLSRDHADMLAKYGWYLVGLLDHVSEVTEVAKIRNMISVLANLAWRGGSTAGTQIRDDVVIFVKKQVHSGIVQYKKMGIVGAVVVARAMVSAFDEEEIGLPMAESSRHSKAGSILLMGLLEEAWELLEFVNNKTQNYPELAGLFLDEMCISFIDNLVTDKNFIEKFKDRFSSNVETDYIEDVREYENDQFGITMKCDMVLDNYDDDDTADDTGAPISVSLTQKVCTSLGLDSTLPVSQRKKASSELARVLPSVRLLIKTIALSKDGDLDDIDALLGCGVWIFPGQTFSTFEQLQSEEKVAVLHSYFYTINWFIELINGFSSQDDGESKRKVLVRLKQIIQMRETLVKELKNHPLYKPPAALFSEDTSAWVSPAVALQKKLQRSAEKKAGKGKGKKSKGAPTETMMNATMNLNTQRMTQTQISQLSRKQTQNTSKEDQRQCLSVDLQAFRPFFREIDLNVLNILQVEPVTTASAPDMTEEIKDPKLRPPELLFLLQDLQTKLDRILNSKNKRGFPGKQNLLSNAGFTNLHNLSQEQVVVKVITSLKFLLAHMDELKEYFMRLKAQTDDTVELLTMCTSESFIILNTIKAGLTALKTLFSWQGFQSSVHEALLKNCLYQIVSRTRNINENSEDLLVFALEYLETFSVCSVTIDVASAHVSLMSSLASIYADNEMVIVAKIATSYLKTEWKQVSGEAEKGAEFRVQIERLLQIFVNNSSNIFRDLKSLCVDGTHLLVEKKEVELFPFINKDTIAVVYKVVLSSLVTEVKKITYGSTKDQDSQLRKWWTAIDTFVKMILDLKTFATRTLLTHVMRLSRLFIDYFIKQGK